MVAPIANLFDDFNDGVIDTTKWTVTAGSWSEATGQFCSTMPSAAAVVQSAAVWSLQQSSAFVEIASFANGAGAASGFTVFEIFSSANSGNNVGIELNASTGNIRFFRQAGGVDAETLTIAYNATTMRWWRFRESDTTFYFETSPDGVTWTVRFTAPSQTWVSSTRALLFNSQVGGAATTKCWDNFNVASASARAVSVGSEFTVSADGKLGINRCDKLDATWPYSCSQSAYTALRRSENPCGMWIQPPAKQLAGVESTVVSTSDSNEQTIISLTLTNPDPCRSMLFYLPLTAGMKVSLTVDEDSGIFSWVLGVMVTGVDNADAGFQSMASNDFGNLKQSHFYRGEADYYWIADPGETTTVVVKTKVFASGGGAKLTQLSARLGYIGMSEMVV